MLFGKVHSWPLVAKSDTTFRTANVKYPVDSITLSDWINRVQIYT